MAKGTIKPSSTNTKSISDSIADGISDFKEKSNVVSQNMTKEEVKVEKLKKEQVLEG